MKKTLKELLALIEAQPSKKLSSGLAWKILRYELLRPRHFLVFLSLPFGIYFATKFVIEIIANELLSTGWLAISNFSLSLDYIANEISFINAFFPYQTFALMLAALVVLVWSGRAAKKQLNHILKLNHII